MAKRIGIYFILSVLSIGLLTFNIKSCEKIKGLESQLETMSALVKEKEKERQREDEAAALRWLKDSQADERLVEVQNDIKVLKRQSATINEKLSTVVPPESLRGLRSYKGNKH